MPSQESALTTPSGGPPGEPAASVCDRDHGNWWEPELLPSDQGGDARHKCAGCAFERGLRLGRARAQSFEMDLQSLPRSQAGAARHWSPQDAFALGFYRGVLESYSHR